MNHAIKLVTLGLFLAMGFAGVEAASTSNFPTVINYDFKSDGAVEVPGRLFTPTQAANNPTQKFPLVIFLHGSDQVGTDNVSQIDSNIDNLLNGANLDGFYLYAPQSSQTVGRCWDDFWRLNDVVLAAGQIVRDYNVDPSRVYIVGISDGGGGAWLMAGNFTNMIAAFSPMSSDDFVVAANVVNKPIWAFHARDDTVEDINDWDRPNINAIRMADPAIGTTLIFPLTDPSYYTFYSSYAGSGEPEDGASYYNKDNLLYTEYPTGGHGTWFNTFDDGTFYTWMLAQTLANQPTPLAQPAAGEKLLFDFGPTITGTVSGQTWNSPGGTNANPLPLVGVGTGIGTEKTLSPAVVFAYASTGHRTPVILSVTKPFNGVATGTSSSTVYPASIASEGWEQGNSVSNADSIAHPAELLLSGLTPAAPYSLKFYGSDTNSLNNCPTRYTINNSASVFGDLTTSGNTSNVATLNIAADSNGQIRIEIAPAPSANANAFYANISALEVAPGAAVQTVSYGAWQTTYFGTDTVNGAATATPRHDGVPNLLKYFSGINPTLSLTSTDRAALPACGMTTVGGIEYLVLSYRQGAAETSVTPHIQSSTDLKTWHTASTTVLSQTVDPTTQNTSFVIGVPVSSATRLFVRLNLAQ